MTQAVEVLPSLAINPTITMCPDSLHRDLLHVALTHSQVNTIMSHTHLQQRGLTISPVTIISQTSRCSNMADKASQCKMVAKVIGQLMPTQASLYSIA